MGHSSAEASLWDAVFLQNDLASSSINRDCGYTVYVKLDSEIKKELNSKLGIAIYDKTMFTRI